ncbi:hypothetical protein BDFB_007982 [Asbolus verrucosus]
MGGLK